MEGTSYENGDSVSGSGTSWYEGAFQTVEHPVDESKAEDISAADLIELLKDRNALTSEKVYRLSEPLKLSSGTKYYGNGAAIIVPQGIIIENANDIVVKEVIVKGKITVTGSERSPFSRLIPQARISESRLTVSQAIYLSRAAA